MNIPEEILLKILHMNTHPSLEIIKDAIREYEKYNYFLWWNFQVKVSFKAYSLSKERNFQELSVSDPQQLFDGIEKCYWNYVNWDKTGFGSHWFYRRDLDAEDSDRLWCNVFGSKNADQLSSHTRTPGASWFIG
jgi:hypothetical protein